MSQAADKQIGIAQQSTWGTAIADNAAFTKLLVEPTTFELDVKKRDNPSSVGTRNKTYGQVVHDTKGAMLMISLSGFARRNDLVQLLYGKIQGVTEGAASPYSKTYVFGDTQPDFASDAGHFLTVIERDPTSSRSLKGADMIVQQLTLTLNAGERLQYSAELVGRGVPDHDSNPSGTWTLVDGNFWHFEDLVRATADWGSG
ncbi:hypothetical protein GF420_11520, partial [candidate division GN15 bacterium]|nr:hypothetical protein [candidate division GN15 bacterium]